MGYIDIKFADFYGMRWDVLENLLEYVKPHPDENRGIRMAELG